MSVLDPLKLSIFAVRDSTSSLIFSSFAILGLLGAAGGEGFLAGTGLFWTGSWLGVLEDCWGLGGLSGLPCSTLMGITLTTGSFLDSFSKDV